MLNSDLVSIKMNSNYIDNKQLGYNYQLSYDIPNNVYMTCIQYDFRFSNKRTKLNFSGISFLNKHREAFKKEDDIFQDPEHLAVDSERNVYVSDRKRDDVQKFMPIIDDNGGTR